MKRREFIVSRFKRQIARLRHKRGHGVHSPYIYNIVREVFMRRSTHALHTPLYCQLLELGVRSRQASEIDNLRHHCGFSSYGVETTEGVDIAICTPDTPLKTTLQMVTEGAKNGTTVVILSPFATPERSDMCNEIIARHHSTTLNRRGYLIIFNNHLPKQHFTL